MAGLEDSNAGNIVAEPTIVDEAYSTACGPIASFVAVRALGLETTLDDMVSQCDWVPGRLTTLNQIRHCLEKFKSIEVRAVRLPPKELLAVLAEGHCVAILPMKTDDSQTFHAVCAVGAKDESIQLIDYPRLLSEVSADDIANVWNGEAIIATLKSNNSRLSLLLMATIPGSLIALALIPALRRLGFGCALSASRPQCVLNSECVIDLRAGVN